MTPGPLGRRRFLKLAAASALAAAAPGCGRDDEPGRYTPADATALARQREREAAASGHGPFGVQRYRGYRGLAELPWFELDPQGRLRCVADEVPRAIDVHAHLGMSLLFAPDVDLAARSERVLHLLDCDGADPGCELDLDVYINANFSEEDLRVLQRGLFSQAFFGSASAATHTIPNLLAEMDATRVERAMVLPIAFGLPFGDDLADRWRAAIADADAGARLVAGASIHPRDADRVADLERQHAAGARLLKLHPTMQRFYPDDPEMLELYAACERLGIVVFFHCGRAGIEPEASHRYALPRHYEAVLDGFPRLQVVLGHGGARDGEEALALAARYDNAWLDVHGQGVSRLAHMIERLDAAGAQGRPGVARLLFGSDWPFYHLAATLAKVLLVTEGRPALRHAVLRGNALQLFEGAGVPGGAKA